MAKMKQCKECKANIPKDARKCMHCGSKQGVGLLGGTFVILFSLFVFGWVVNTIYSPSPPSKMTTVSTAPVSTVVHTNENTISTEKLNYKVISINKKGTLINITVFTPKKNGPNIIKINDKLLRQYHAGNTHIFINYFDDTAIANVYFKKISDQSVSEGAKDKLVAHYIARMVYNASTNYKALAMNKNNNWITLKKY